MNRTCRYAALVALTAILIVPAWAARDESETKTPSLKDIVALKSPSGPRLSPDGQWIVYSVREADWEKNEFRSLLWRADIESGDILQLTYGDKSSSAAAWSPDSQWVSFKSSRDGKPQIYLLSMRGGEARQLTDSETGVGSYSWSPDSKTIAFTAKDDESKRDKAIEEKYGHFEIIDRVAGLSRLWTIDVQGGESRIAADVEGLHVTGMSWSPDGKTLAFSANPDSRLKSFSKSDLYLVSIESGQIRPLVHQVGPERNPVWSPDGQRIAFNSSDGTESYFVNTEICIVAAAGGKPDCISKDFDENASLNAWKENGIYFSSWQKMSRHLFRIQPDGTDLKRISSGDDMTGRGYSLSQDGSRVAFSYVNADRYPEIYWSSTSEFRARTLTDFSQQLEGWTLSRKEPIRWKSRDGVEISGVLIKPADFDPAKKYPLFVIIHGGPTGISIPQRVDRYNRYYPIEQWAAKGALILEPNYRGSAGFGSKFRSLNYRNLGVGDYWDVISGVDHLVEQGFVDKNRVASMGWSQGGYISAFITTFSDRFAATSVGAGISDWITYYYATDITPFTRHYLGATPWDDMEIYRKTSPMTHINRARTPTLIQHGEFDRRVPTSNAYKLYRGLQDKGVPSKLIIYKGFGHGINKPKESLAVLTHNRDWFAKYIWDEEPEEERFEEVEESTGK